MPITMKKYVDIVSGVGGVAQVAQRELIGRIFTDNDLLPVASFVEMTTLDDVGAFFGTSSEEYKRARFYFGFVSKNVTKAKKIAFARVNLADEAARITGGKTLAPLAQWQAITTGALTLTIGGVTLNATGLDFSAALSYADVASVIQTAVRTGTGAVFTGATVTYNATARRFDLVAGATGANDISTGVPPVGVDIRSVLNWVPTSDPITGPRYSDGAVAQTPVDSVTASATASNSFGSFLFMPSLTLEQITAVAAWNDTENVAYMYTVRVTATDVAAYVEALADYSGVCLTLADGTADDFPEMLPMTVQAATDYSRRNSTVNYMFQQAALTPTVTDTSVSNAMDAARVNYYGQTQQAGAKIAFYQRGYMLGLATDPLDMNTYSNEQWLKDKATSSLMSLLLALGKVSANEEGRSQVVAQLQQDVIGGQNQAGTALYNGTISAGKELTPTQRAYITQVTGDPDAWRQVQGVGYWLDVEIVLDGTDYKARYILVYSKDDAIRKVEGSDILI